MVYFTPEEIQVIKDAMTRYEDNYDGEEIDPDWAIESASTKTLFALMGVDFPGVGDIYFIETESDEIYSFNQNSDDSLWNKLFHNWTPGVQSWLELLQDTPSVNINDKALPGVYGGYMFGQYFNDSPTVLFIADDHGMERIYFRACDFNKLFPIK